MEAPKFDDDTGKWDLPSENTQKNWREREREREREEENWEENAIEYFPSSSF